MTALLQAQKPKPTGNAKFRPLAVAVTPGMLEAGKNALAQIVNGDEEHTDDGLVAAVFIEMWNAYWTEIEGVRRKKTAGSPLVKPKTGLILPPGTR